MLAVFVAVSSAFSPTTLAPRSAVSLRVRSVPAPVAMAGWNDEYQTDNPGRKKQVLKTDKTDFDAEMARTGKLGGMDSAPPAFVGLSLFVVAYLVYLVVAA